jgi:hypothetical protein
MESLAGPADLRRSPATGAASLSKTIELLEFGLLGFTRIKTSPDDCLPEKG